MPTHSWQSPCSISCWRSAASLRALLPSSRVAERQVCSWRTVFVAAAAAWWALQRTRSYGGVAPRAIGGDVARAAVQPGPVVVDGERGRARGASLPQPRARRTVRVASVLGKAVLWLPVALHVHHVPAGRTPARDGGDARSLLLVAFAISAAICSAGVLGLLLLGPAVIPVFFGSRYSQAAGIAWKVGLACVRSR